MPKACQDRIQLSMQPPVARSPRAPAPSHGPRLSVARTYTGASPAIGRNVIGRRRTAWLALFAMLFSAVSPALAAAFLGDRPAALGQMLGIPAPSAASGSED